MALTRRAFLGLLGVAAATPGFIVGTHNGNMPFGQWAEAPEGLAPIVLDANPFDDDGKGVSLAYATRFLHRRILKHLGPSYQITGSKGVVYLGSMGIGLFDKMITSFVPAVDGLAGGRLEIDRRFLDELAAQTALSIKDAGIVHTGELETPHGQIDSFTVVNKRLSLRGVSVYDIIDNNIKVRWDILGASRRGA